MDRPDRPKLESTEQRMPVTTTGEFKRVIGLLGFAVVSLLLLPVNNQIGVTILFYKGNKVFEIGN